MGSLIKYGAIERLRKSITGGKNVDEKAKNLADDLRHVPTLVNLQSWGVETMARFQAGQVKSNGGSPFFGRILPSDYLRRKCRSL